MSAIVSPLRPFPETETKRLVLSGGAVIFLSTTPVTRDSKGRKNSVTTQDTPKIDETEEQCLARHYQFHGHAVENGHYDHDYR